MRKKLTAVVLAVLVFSLIAASAASLGGINSADIGADTDVVASCDTDGVDVAFGAPSYNDATRVYEIDSLTVSGIADACEPGTVAVSISDGPGTNYVDLGTESVVAGASNDHTASFTGFTFDAEALRRVAVAITTP